MPSKPEFLTIGQAARRLGVSPKALRLYEDHELLAPGRTRAGWRVYGATDMARAKDVISLRRFGLGLAEIATVLAANPSSRDDLLARHQSRLESRMHALGATVREVSSARKTHQAGSPVARQAHAIGSEISFDLPWPWGGERFSLPHLQPLTYITGPLGSGKTRFAIRLAEALPGGHFLGLDRLDSDGTLYASRLNDDARLRTQCDSVLLSLENNGATKSPALMALIAALCSGDMPVVIDMVEQGLDHGTQLALSRHLRHRDHPARPLFLMTRSSAILDLTTAESGETIIYCPANHSPPLIVRPDPMCPGYEAVATCLATPEVRARTSGVIATWAPPVAATAS